MLQFKCFKIIPLNIVKYSNPYFNDRLFTCHHARNFIRLKICIGFSSVCSIWIFGVINVTFECNDIFLYAIQIDYTSSKFKHN